MPVLSFDQVAAVALAAGFPPGAAAIAVAVTGPESARNSGAIQQGEPYDQTGWGLWQITPGNSVPRYGIDRALLVPLNNGRAAHYKWAQAGGFYPWTTYEDRAYLSDLGPAEAAVARVSHLSRAKIDALAKAAKAGQGTGPGGGGDINDWSPQVAAAAGHTGRAARQFYGHAAGIRRLKVRAVAPIVRPPSPLGIVWTPQHPEET